MPKYESINRAISKYAATHYDHMTIRVPSGCREQIKAKADEAGISVNRYILEALEQRSGLKLTLDKELPYKRT